MRDLARAGKADFTMLSGCDGTALAFTLMGGHGTISVTANVAPRLMHQMIAAALKGDLAAAREAQRPSCCRCTSACSLKPIRSRSNGRWRAWVSAGGALRLPMTQMSVQHVAALEDAMRQAGIRGLMMAAYLLNSGRTAVAPARGGDACGACVALAGCSWTSRSDFVKTDKIDYKSQGQAQHRAFA